MTPSHPNRVAFTAPESRLPKVHDRPHAAARTAAGVLHGLDGPVGDRESPVHGNNRMTESAANCQYLCSLKQPTPLQVEPDEAEYGSHLNTLHFGEATLTFPQTLVLRYSRFEPEERRQPVVAADYARWFLARLRTLEVRLAQEDYLCAGRFTAVDFSVGYALMLADYLDLSSRFTPAVTAY